MIAIIGILASVGISKCCSWQGSDVKIVSGVRYQNNNRVKLFWSKLSRSTNDSPLYGGLVADGNPGTSTINMLLNDINSLNSEVNVENYSNTAGSAVLDYAVYGRLVSTST